MEDTTIIQDWELLQSPDAAAPFAGIPKVSDGVDDGSEDGAIKSDYFALDSDERRLPSEAESEEGGVDSDNPSWVDPDSDSRYGDPARGQMAFAEMGFRPKVSNGFWSDESSDGQRSVPDSERRELGEVGELMTELGFEGIESGYQVTEGDVSAEGGQSESVNMRDESDPPLAPMSDVRDVLNDGFHDGGKRGTVWWKMPFELLKFCVLRVRPIWSLSIAAAFVGVVMLGRRLYKMKHKSRKIPLRVIFDDKRASQFMIRAARLNEAFSVVRRTPIIRPALPAGGGVTPWPALSLR